MILTLLSVFIIFLGLIFLVIHHAKSGYNEWDTAANLTLIIGGAVLLAFLILIATREPCADAKVRKFEAVQATLDKARLNENISPLELAALQQKAVEKNEELAGLKFWAQHPLSNWFYSKKILAIKPIE